MLSLPPFPLAPTPPIPYNSGRKLDARLKVIACCATLEHENATTCLILPACLSRTIINTEHCSLRSLGGRTERGDRRVYT